MVQKDQDCSGGAAECCAEVEGTKGGGQNEGGCCSCEDSVMVPNGGPKKALCSSQACHYHYSDLLQGHSAGKR